MDIAPLVRAEFGRLTSSRALRLALIAVLLLPAVYAGLYLFAHRDPYANLSQVPAAVVVEDRGATLANGERIDAGRNAATALVKARTLDWHEVTRDEAVAGVRDERYALAVVLPADFSAALVSATGSAPRRATIEEISSNTNGYLSRTISSDLVRSVSDAVASRISASNAGQVLAGFSTIHTDVSWAADGTEQLASVLRQLSGGVPALNTTATQLNSSQAAALTSSGAVAAATRKAKDSADILTLGATEADRLSATVDQQTASLPAQAKQLTDAAAAVATANGQVAAAGREASAATTGLQRARQERLGAVMTALSRLETANATQAAPSPQVAQAATEIRLALLGLNTDLDTAATAMSTASGRLVDAAIGTEKVTTSATSLASTVGAVHTAATQAHQSTTKLTGVASTVATSLDGAATQSATFAAGRQQDAARAAQLAAGLTTISNNLSRSVDATTTLHERLATTASTIPNPDPEQRKLAAQILGSPIAVKPSDEARSWTFGAGMAPLYGALALWVGGYLLARHRRRVTSATLLATGAQGGAVSRWALLAALAAGQAVLVGYLVFHGFGLRIDHPWLLVPFMILAGLAFAAILVVLVERLGRTGLLVGLGLAVLQAICAGGVFPWQALPEPLRAAHHVLPLSYAVDAIRQLMYGGALGRVGLDALVLTGFLTAAVAASVIGARHTSHDGTARRSAHDSTARRGAHDAAG